MSVETWWLLLAQNHCKSKQRWLLQNRWNKWLLWSRLRGDTALAALLKDSFCYHKQIAHCRKSPLERFCSPDPPTFPFSQRGLQLRCLHWNPKSWSYRSWRSQKYILPQVLWQVPCVTKAKLPLQLKPSFSDELAVEKPIQRQSSISVIYVSLDVNHSCWEVGLTGSQCIN